MLDAYLGIGFGWALAQMCHTTCKCKHLGELGNFILDCIFWPVSIYCHWKEFKTKANNETPSKK